MFSRTRWSKIIWLNRTKRSCTPKEMRNLHFLKKSIFSKKISTNLANTGALVPVRLKEKLISSLMGQFGMKISKLPDTKVSVELEKSPFKTLKNKKLSVYPINYSREKQTRFNLTQTNFWSLCTRTRPPMNSEILKEPASTLIGKDLRQSRVWILSTSRPETASSSRAASFILAITVLLFRTTLKHFKILNLSSLLIQEFRKL